MSSTWMRLDFTVTPSPRTAAAATRSLDNDSASPGLRFNCSRTLGNVRLSHEPDVHVESISVHARPEFPHNGRVRLPSPRFDHYDHCLSRGGEPSHLPIICAYISTHYPQEPFSKELAIVDDFDDGAGRRSNERRRLEAKFDKWRELATKLDEELGGKMYEM
ncbi:Hypothetical protein CINCED_3A017103 [Cinara cedri]|uniref:Uncharacterized protein n=1 Tax=Cinara cedri TaxID=506608 RepID=A0A5E4NF66_9HEMI|nr:Hypothetical protein CINCED_3A017103 [Cinara cedri]